MRAAVSPAICGAMQAPPALFFGWESWGVATKPASSKRNASANATSAHGPQRFGFTVGFASRCSEVLTGYGDEAGLRRRTASQESCAWTELKGVPSRRTREFVRNIGNMSAVAVVELR